MPPRPSSSASTRPRRPPATAANAPADAVRVFTDGACAGNPGPGGWGWATTDGRQASGSENPSTNQRMEVWAVLDALRTLLAVDPARHVVVVSDSTYVVNCFRDEWWKGWQARGWRNSQKQPVANQDLWKPLIDTYLGDRDRLHFEWVKGHSGNPMNDLVDELAVAAAAARAPRHCVGVPDADDVALAKPTAATTLSLF